MEFLYLDGITLIINSIYNLSLKIITIDLFCFHISIFIFNVFKFFILNKLSLFFISTTPLSSIQTDL